MATKTWLFDHIHKWIFSPAEMLNELAGNTYSDALAPHCGSSMHSVVQPVLLHLPTDVLTSWRVVVDQSKRINKLSLQTAIFLFWKIQMRESLRR